MKKSIREYNILNSYSQFGCWCDSCEGLKKGDKVIYCEQRNIGWTNIESGYEILTIERILKTKIVFDNGTEKKNSGKTLPVSMYLYTEENLNKIINMCDHNKVQIIKYEIQYSHDTTYLCNNKIHWIRAYLELIEEIKNNPDLE